MYSRTPEFSDMYILVTSDTKSAKDDQPGLGCYIADVCLRRTVYFADTCYLGDTVRSKLRHSLCLLLPAP